MNCWLCNCKMINIGIKEITGIGLCYVFECYNCDETLILPKEENGKNILKIIK